MTSIKASLLSTRLFDNISKRHLQGRIHSRFENAINIELEDGYLFNILCERVPPNSRSLIVSLREWHLIQSLIPAPGMAVCIRGYQVEIPVLFVTIAFSTSRLWDPTPSLSGPPTTSTGIHQNLEMVSKIVAQSAETENCARSLMADPQKILEKIPYKTISQASRDAFIRTACEASHDLLVSIRSLDSQGVSKASSRLIGLGPGLTPSGDDVLAGVMAAGVFFSLAYEGLRSEVRRINSWIISKVPGRTTTHSQILLNDASSGEIVRPLGQLLQGILCGDEVLSLISLTRQVMALGESSGKDTLVGVLIGLEAFMRLEERMNGK